MKAPIFLLVMSAMLNPYPFADAAEHTNDSIETVKKRVVSKEAILIDVREQEEWDEGHLQQAQLVPLSALINKVDRSKAIQKLPEKKIIYCHCRSGVRVLKASEILKVEGFDIRPLKQGYRDLLESGLEQAD